MDQTLVANTFRQLRNRLAESQPAFARRFSVTPRMTAYWEGAGKPPMSVVYRCALIAREHDWSDLADVLTEALQEEAGAPILVLTPRESEWSRLVVALVRDDSTPAGEVLSVLADAALKYASTLDGEKRIRLEELVILARSAMGGAESKLKALAAQRAKVTGESEATAYAEVLFANPDLYTEAMKERAQAGKGTQFEASMRVHGTADPMR